MNAERFARWASATRLRFYAIMGACMVGVVALAVGVWWLVIVLAAGAAAQDITPGGASRATRVPTLDGMPFAGPANSDCQVYAYSNGTDAINCPIQFLPVTGAHTVQANEWGSVLVASGGGTVTITLPTMTSIGRNTIGVATDGKTSIVLVPQAPAVLQGSALIRADGTLAAPANSSGFVGLASSNVFQVSFR